MNKLPVLHFLEASVRAAKYEDKNFEKKLIYKKKEYKLLYIISLWKYFKQDRAHNTDLPLYFDAHISDSVSIVEFVEVTAKSFPLFYKPTKEEYENLISNQSPGV